MAISATIAGLVGRFGYAAVAAAVGLESSGLPLPGEATLVAAALYAGSTHRLDIRLVALTAAVAAVLGDNVGYLLGRLVGTRLLVRHGRRVGLDEPRLKLGRYLFDRYGPVVVVLGRFTAVLRTWVALMAGASGMRWPRFLVANGIGGLLWAAVYSLGPYALGEQAARLSRPVGLGLLVVTLAGAVGGALLIRRHAGRLMAAAELAYPGPLMPSAPVRPGSGGPSPAGDAREHT